MHEHTADFQGLALHINANKLQKGCGNSLSFNIVFVSSLCRNSYISTEEQTNTSGEDMDDEVSVN